MALLPEKLSKMMILRKYARQSRQSFPLGIRRMTDGLPFNNFCQGILAV
jgi:hypothetical protein